MIVELTPSQTAYLRNGLVKFFDISELKTLCVDIGVDYDNLSGSGKEEKARELLAYLERRGRVRELIEYCCTERPNFAWEEGLRTQRASRKIESLVETGGAQTFWEPFADGELQVIIGRFTKFQGFEESGLIGGGDAIALIELSSFFAALDLRDFKVTYADQLDGDNLKTNLVVLGGPDANSVSMELARRINSTLRFGNPENHEIALYDLVDKETFAPLQWPGQKSIFRDYGIIYKTRNPFNAEKSLLLIGGSFGYGTWGGARFVTSKEFLNNSLLLTYEAFECLIEVDVFRGKPQVIRLLKAYQLKASK